MFETLRPVILCGGSGTRLWPLSRRDFPKQLISMSNGRSPFQNTLERVRDAGILSRPMIIANEAYRFTVLEQMAQIAVDGEIVLEPEGRDSGPAIAAAACLAASRDPDAVLIILPSDHQVSDITGFTSAVEEALDVAATGRMVTFGIAPASAATTFGYIHPGQRLNIAGSRALAIRRFSEKPGAAAAARYLSEGALWNSGMFVIRAADALEAFTAHRPDILWPVQAAVDAALPDLAFLRLGRNEFLAAPRISFDHAVMEQVTDAAVIPVDFGWSDIGSWAAVWENSARDEAGNVTAGDVVLEATGGTLVHSEGPLTVVVGMSDVVVVASDDAVLVANRNDSGKIKNVVRSLQESRRSEALHHPKVNRPWGFFQTLQSGPRFRVKRICVQPGCKLSLQKHAHRSEHWVVVCGAAEMTVEANTKILRQNESSFIPAGAIHRLSNPGTSPLEIIEVQTGEILEDDIIRLEDEYGRITSL